MQLPGPDTRVVELRVHGILGTTGDALTDSVASVDVAGDGIGRIVRPADRLRRPVPGPVLTTGERKTPRIVEGYVWGGMTSGGLGKATWALLFPFALANVAHWMLPVPHPENVVGRVLSSALRALVRLASLVLTMLLVAQLTVLGLDLVVSQCLAPGSACMDVVPEVLRGFDFLRASAALLPVGLIVLLMHRLSTVSWRVATDKEQNSQPSGQTPSLPGGNVVSDPDTPALRAMHVVGALSIVVLLALGGPFTASSDPRWLAAAALATISLIITAGMDDPLGVRPGTRGTAPRVMLSRIPRRILMSLAGVLVAAVAIVPPPLAGPLPGSGRTIDALTGLLLAICVAVAVLLVPTALISRPRWKSIPASLRPWAGGWMAAPVLLVACLLGGGFGAGLALLLRRLLHHPDLQLPTAFNDVTVFWGAATVLLASALLAVLPWTAFTLWRAAHSESSVPAEVALLHAGRQQDQRRAARAWRWAELQRRYAHHVLLLVASVLAFSTVLSLGFRLFGSPLHLWVHWLSGLGVFALGALAVGLLRMVHMAAKSREPARYLGILCDLTLFWPREAHPVVPPCYALKVVPELAARAAEHLADPDTRVVLVGHSQGSLLATVATARLLDSLPEEEHRRVGLVTAGSQLQWAYPRAFPGVLPHDALRSLAGTLGGRWRSLCRGTDPIGGAVTTWNRQVYDGMLIGVGFRPDGTEGPLPAAVRGPTGALVLGGDHWLPDPQRGPFSDRRWVPGVLGHTDYRGDPEWDRAVAMAAGLEAPVRSANLPLLTSTTAQASSAPKSAERDRIRPHGDDGGSLADHSGASRELVEGDLPEADSGQVEEVATARPQPAELPEIIDPRGRMAPWERGVSLRSSDR